jgi:hypothetical protein
MIDNLNVYLSAIKTAHKTLTALDYKHFNHDLIHSISVLVGSLMPMTLVATMAAAFELSLMTQFKRLKHVLQHDLLRGQSRAHKL